MSRETSFAKKCRYAAEAAAAYFIYGLFRLMPVEMASACGGRTLRFLGPRMGVSRVALKNLDLAFPEKTADEKKEILRDMWENLGRVLGEYPHLRHMGRDVEVEGMDHFTEMRDSGKPAIMFAGHLANWEINAVCAQANGLPLHVVYRKPNNPYVDSLLRHARSLSGGGYIEKGEGGARAIRTALKNKGVVALLIDQKLNEGVAVPFFGHDAMTTPAAALFALKFGLPLYPVRGERLKGARFRLTVYPPLKVVKTGDDEADTRRILEEMNLLLEIWVRARPEQWLWTHKRWPESK